MGGGYALVRALGVRVEGGIWGLVPDTLSAATPPCNTPTACHASCSCQASMREMSKIPLTLQLEPLNGAHCGVLELHSAAFSAPENTE